jgi:uncharacterized protein
MRNKQSEIIQTLSDRELLLNVFLTQTILVVIAIVIGSFTFESLDDFLNLLQWDYLEIILIGGGTGIGIVALDICLMRILPSSYYDDGGINERIFGSLSYPMILIVSLVVAISEEVLFRGVIQTEIGLIGTSFIFALVHYRYLFNWFLFINIVSLSFVIGLIFQWTDNLLVTIFAHFLIDCLLGFMIRRKNSKPR